MSIAVVGVNHRTAPLEVRERFAHAPRDVATSLERLRSAGAGGGVLLSTCNRTEFYIAEPAEAVPEAVWAILTERLGGIAQTASGTASAGEPQSTRLKSPPGYTSSSRFLFEKKKTRNVSTQRCHTPV